MRTSGLLSFTCIDQRGNRLLGRVGHRPQGVRGFGADFLVFICQGSCQVGHCLLGFASQFRECIGRLKADCRIVGLQGLSPLRNGLVLVDGFFPAADHEERNANNDVTCHDCNPRNPNLPRKQGRVH